MIRIENVVKKYGDKRVLNGVTFKVEPGDFLSIIGPSGAGKTTLIHSIIGSERIDSGSIIVDNYEVSNLSFGKMQEYRRNIGIIFQDFKLLPQKTVFENVAFSLEVCGYPMTFIKERVVDVIRLTGIEDQRNHYPHQISGGEKQRTAIARALAHAPDFLIADEPTGNLDPENGLALASLLKKINKAGTTVIVSTHDRDMVDFMKARVITLDQGKVVSDRDKAGYYN